jgi:ubiquinone/menaquinone biosynthesis C-methylase UbiE
VRRLYDWGAADYDRIKATHPLEEFAFLGRPLQERLEATAGPRPLVLDVGTGTGRLALALLEIPYFEGTVVGLDLSAGMLARAAEKTAAQAERYPLLLGPATPLPFEDGTFDAVALLEVLELLPDRDAALAEAYRVLRPGGYLVASNRRGWHARLMPGKTDAPVAFRRRLARLGWLRIHILPWQDWYDLAWARKPGRLGPRTDERPWSACLRPSAAVTVVRPAPDRRPTPPQLPS